MLTTAAASGIRSTGYARGSIRTESQLASLRSAKLFGSQYVAGADWVITGFNTDIKHNDKVYHIQTEDKGLQNPYIESLVYVGGEILASKKTSYAEQLKTGFDEKLIGGLMEQQHRTMIAAIKRGRFDQPADATKSAAPRPSMPTLPDNE